MCGLACRVRVSEMFLGPVREGFHFAPKHRSNAFEPSERDRDRDRDNKERERKLAAENSVSTDEGGIVVDSAVSEWTAVTDSSEPMPAEIKPDAQN